MSTKSLSLFFTFVSFSLLCIDTPHASETNSPHCANVSRDKNNIVCLDDDLLILGTTENGTNQNYGVKVGTLTNIKVLDDRERDNERDRNIDQRYRLSELMKLTINPTFYFNENDKPHYLTLFESQRSKYSADYSYLGFKYVSKNWSPRAFKIVSSFGKFYTGKIYRYNSYVVEAYIVAEGALILKMSTNILLNQHYTDCEDITDQVTFWGQSKGSLQNESFEKYFAVTFSTKN
jgi:hypothetical protein